MPRVPQPAPRVVLRKRLLGERRPARRLISAAKAVRGAHSLGGRRRSARPVAALLLALALALVLSACGAADRTETSGTYAGEGGAAAPHLDVGPLVYEVQISRALNPYDTEDAAYLQAIPSLERKLQPGEEWFGVFMKVFNESNTPHHDAGEITISDTEGDVYRPIALGHYNLFAYRPGEVPPKSEIPLPDSTANTNPIGGALLLYKIPLTALDNRPIDVHIVSPSDSAEKASAELDV